MLDMGREMSLMDANTHFWGVECTHSAFIKLCTVAFNSVLVQQIGTASNKMQQQYKAPAFQTFSGSRRCSCCIIY